MLELDVHEAVPDDRAARRQASPLLGRGGGPMQVCEAGDGRPPPGPSQQERRAELEVGWAEAERVNVVEPTGRAAAHRADFNVQD